ncbi:ABC transporter substrate-binding protein [Sphingomonas sp.]|jgi:iron complex transport system substrate-binding protein|uniref:ABC transporter substrate-binding protein n=1 Tax=Sphingomonas sp. TaxID=28214 RepID=UPI002EDB66C4
MIRALAVPLALAGCAQAPAPSLPQLPVRPMRIVSLDYCADQYALKLVARDRILALSPDAQSDFSYMRKAARGVASVAPRAEDVLVLRPDLVIRSYGGGPGVAAFLEKAGVPVLQIGYASDIAGVRQTLVDVAEGLGEPVAGERVAVQMDARLAALRRRPMKQTALYMTPGGVTTGAGTLVDEMLRTAGYRNFQRDSGWQPLPLERLAYGGPDVVAAAFFGSRTNHPDRWSAARHPIARAQLRDRPVVGIEGAWTACGGWFLLDAIEALANAGARR